MQIKVNEQHCFVNDHETAGTVKKQFKDNADLIIVNGYPASEKTVLNDGDQVVLIQRGEMPSEAELETLLTARHTPGVHQVIKTSIIGIAGVGGLGSAIAIALARTGVGQIILADFDVVEPSNLNRQQFFVDQIGMPKVYALRDTLQRISPYVRVTACHLRLAADNIATVFGHAQILVEAFDQAEQKAMLVETFGEFYPGRPVVAASGLAGYGPSNTIQTKQVGNHFYLCGDRSTPAEPGSGLMAPRVGIAAHHQANAVLRLLLDKNPEKEDT